MPKQSKGTEWRGNALEFLRGGKTVPAGFLRRRMAAVKRSMAERFKVKNAIEQETAKYWSQIQEPARPIGTDPQVVRAMDGLLGIHKKLAKQKLAAPKVAAALGGFFPGRFAAKVTPPYDYAFAYSGSADKNTGQASGSAVTDPQSPSTGDVFAYTEMGIYFRPMFGPATLTLKASASPAVSLEWWTNSLYPDSKVLSWGSGCLGIWAALGRWSINSAEANFASWDEESTQEVHFDFRSIPPAPVSAELEVDNSMFCVMYVATFNRVRGVGWPGSLAGSMMSITVPSITFELDLIQVVNPG